MNKINKTQKVTKAKNLREYMKYDIFGLLRKI